MKATNNTFFGKQGLIVAGIVGTAICLLSLSICLAQDIPPATVPASGPVPLVAPTTSPSLATTAPATEPAALSATTAPTTMPEDVSATATTLPTTLPATAPADASPIATTAPVANVATPRQAAQGFMTLNFKDVALRTVLEYLSDAAGMIVIEEDKVEGRVTLMSRQPISRDEALSLLDSVLKQKGFAAIRVGRTLKIVTLDKAKRESVPVQIGDDSESIQLGDRIITQIIPIQYADATKLKTDLSSLIPSTADFTSNASSNTIILTASQTTVRHIVEIIKAIDTHMSDVSQVKVFQLKFANATSASKLITDIFNENPNQNQGNQGGRNQRFIVMGGPGGGGGGGGGDDKSKRTVKVTASADDRTNTVVISAPADVMKVIEGVVKELDANPAQAQAVFIYHLKNGVAADLEPVLNNIFGTGSGSSSSSGSRSTVGNRNTSSSNNRSRSNGGAFSSSGSSNSGMRGLGSNSTGSNGTNRAGTSGSTRTGTGSTAGGRSMTPQNQASSADLIGQVYVVAEPDTNSLLVTTSSANFDRVKLIIEDLDRAVPQVLIKVLIAEVTHDNSLDLGMEFSGMNLRAGGKGFNSGSEFGVNTKIGAGLGTNGFVFQLNEDNITAAIRALSTVTKLDVLSRPYILTSDNQEAQIMVGQSVPFVTNTQTFDTGAINNSIEYDDIGIILDVTPHINPTGLVTMDVYPEISTLTGDTVPISNSLNAPVFAKRFAQARVAVRDGQTIVIGGLMQDQLTKSIDKVPGLGDIPGLGILFQHKTEKKTKTELLIFITPHVALQPDELKDMSEKEKAGLKIVPQAVEPGAFDEHLKGLDRGASTRPALAPNAHVVDILPTTEPAQSQPADPKSNGNDTNGNGRLPTTPVMN